MHPSGIALRNTYVFAEQSEGKAQDWGELLWRKLRDMLHAPAPAALRSQDQYAYLSDRLANYVHTRLVVRGAQIAEIHKGLSPERLEAELGELVDSLLDVSAEARDDVVWHLTKICPRIVDGGAKLSRSQLTSVRRFAETNSHRCCFCGHSLMYAEGDGDPPEDVPDEVPPEMAKPFEFWAFEVEHLFPQKRGGSRAPVNLTAACKSCNKYKDVLINFSDLPVETFLTSSYKPENIKAAFGGVKKFALLWRQAGCCARCDLPFYETQDERLILLRRNDDAYHFFNVEIVCGTCGDQDPKGVELRA